MFGFIANSFIILESITEGNIGLSDYPPCPVFYNKMLSLSRNYFVGIKVLELKFEMKIIHDMATKNVAMNIL